MLTKYGGFVELRRLCLLNDRLGTSDVLNFSKKDNLGGKQITIMSQGQLLPQINGANEE